MKNNIKTITLISLLLGSLFYLLSNKQQTIVQYKTTSAKDEPIIFIDKKTLPLPAPKALDFVAPAQNGLTIDNNWKSR
jgi:hypothetical protein